MEINELFFLGTNKYGQAGIGEKYHNKKFTVPKPFALSVFIKQLSCGSHHSALLTIDGLVYTMGSNIHGALGCSSQHLNYSFLPILVESLKDVSKIECGSYHMCAITDGELFSWGKGIDGQLGHGDTKNVSVPTKVLSLGNNVQSVSCGTNHTLVLCSRSNSNNLSAYSFGNGIFGQLGSGNNRNSYNPALVKLDSVDFCSAGQNHSLFISRGNVYASGDNTTGQLGISGSKKYVLEPVEVIINNQKGEIIMVQANKFSAALTNSGQIYIWGSKSNNLHPKMLKASFNRPGPQEFDFIDLRVGKEELLCLTSEGTLHSFNIQQAQSTSEFGKQILKAKGQILIANGRAILDFSIGENYSLILGDIIKQISYSGDQEKTLVIDDLQESPSTDWEQNRIQNGTKSFQNRARSSIRHFKESNRDIDQFSNSKFSSQNATLQQKINEINQLSHSIASLNHLCQPSKQEENLTLQYMEKKDVKDHQSIIFQAMTNMEGELQEGLTLKSNNNSSLCSQQTNQNRQMEQLDGSPFDKKQSSSEIEQKVYQGLREKNLNNFLNKNHGKSIHIWQEREKQYSMDKTPSSSILCEPHNFLKESTSRQNYEERKKQVTQLTQQHSNHEGENPNKPMKKKYNFSYCDKQNCDKVEQKGKEVQKVSRGSAISIKKQQKAVNSTKSISKIDKIMKMLEDSSNISAIENRFEQKVCQSRDLSKSGISVSVFGKCETNYQGSIAYENRSSDQSQAQSCKSNRLLRLQLRDKELKISQLQEALSRKQMEIEAQRQLIKVLRIKNESNFSSIEGK